MTGPSYHGRTHGRKGTDPVPFESGRMPWANLHTDLNGVTVPSGSDYYPEISGRQPSPFAGGGSFDTNVFGGIADDGSAVDLNTASSVKAIQILQPGLYMYEISGGWFLDWGRVRTNYDVTHSDGFFSVLNFDTYLHGTENSYFGGASDATDPQITLHARSMLSVDDRATDVQLRGFYHNSSGSSRTFNNTTRVGIFIVWIVQLSSDGNSNPAY